MRGQPDKVLGSSYLSWFFRRLAFEPFGHSGIFARHGLQLLPRIGCRCERGLLAAQQGERTVGLICEVMHFATLGSVLARGTYLG